MPLNVGIVGVGPVGDRLVSILREREFPCNWPPRVMATSARQETVGGEVFNVLETSDDAFDGLDLVFFAGREGAKGASVQFKDAALAAGAKAIDNSSDFRMDPSVPLVVPEVNMDAVSPEHRFIANPNCSTIQMVVALAPLHRAAHIERIVVSTYQSVSGWGKRAQEQLLSQTQQMLESGAADYDPTVFACPIAFNYIPHIDRFTEDAYTKEELKMIRETRKIFGEPDMRISPTAVRVPVFVGHGESINIETREKLTADEAREILRNPAQSPGVVVIDEPSGNMTRNDPLERVYPTARHVEDERYKDAVLVGRIREDPTVEAGLNLWVVSDNLRKGAALNAIQIAEEMLRRGYI